MTGPLSESLSNLGCQPAPGRCRVCGREIAQARRLVCPGRTVMRRGRKVTYPSRCELLFLENHDRNRARRAAKARFAAEWSGRKITAFRCNGCGSLTSRPEVNHIAPVNGVRTWRSCLNHQSNLEVLCHACHSLVTAEQSRERARLRRLPGADPIG